MTVAAIAMAAMKASHSCCACARERWCLPNKHLMRPNNAASHRPPYNVFGAARAKLVSVIRTEQMRWEVAAAD